MSLYVDRKKKQEKKRSVSFYITHCFLVHLGREDDVVDTVLSSNVLDSVVVLGAETLLAQVVAVPSSVVPSRNIEG